MAENYRRSACRNRRPEYRPRLDGADAVLASHGDNGCAGHVVVAAQEERREVLSIGEAQHRVHRPRCHSRVGHNRFGESERAAGLDETDFVDRDFLERDFQAVRAHLGNLLWGWGAGFSGSFAKSGTPRRSSA